VGVTAGSREVPGRNGLWQEMMMMMMMMIIIIIIIITNKRRDSDTAVFAALLATYFSVYSQT
jgi:hypothetical protein